MRDLTTDDLGLLLSVFAVLLVSFAIDFGFSRHAARIHHRAVTMFGIMALIGELASALAIVLCWVAIWSPIAWEYIDDYLVFGAGSVAILCAVVLTVEKGMSRLEALQKQRRAAADSDDDDESEEL